MYNGEDNEVESPLLKFTNEPTKEGSIIRNIKSATPDKLVERLTYEKYPDTNFQKNFLLTYRSIMTPYQLFEKLILRYCLTPPHNNSVNIKQSHQIPVRLR